MPEKLVLVHFQEFLRGLDETSYADETVRAISVDVRALEKYAMRHVEGDLTRKKVLSSRMVMGFIEAGENKAIIIRRLYSMRRLVEYALENGFVDSDFLADVSYLTFLENDEKSLSPEVPTYITEDETRKLLDRLGTHLEECKCCSLYVLLGMYLSGISGQEARGVLVKDVYRQKSGQVCVRVGKRDLPLSERVDQDIYWRSVRCLVEGKGLSPTDNFSVFTSQQTILYHLNCEARRAGIERRVRLVDFRRRRMLDMKEVGYSPEEIADQLGMNSNYVRDVLARIKVV